MKWWLGDFMAIFDKQNLCHKSLKKYSQISCAHIPFFTGSVTYISPSSYQQALLIYK